MIHKYAAPDSSIAKPITIKKDSSLLLKNKPAIGTFEESENDNSGDETEIEISETVKDSITKIKAERLESNSFFSVELFSKLTVFSGGMGAGALETAHVYEKTNPNSNNHVANFIILLFDGLMLLTGIFSSIFWTSFFQISRKKRKHIFSFSEKITNIIAKIFTLISLLIYGAFVVIVSAGYGLWQYLLLELLR